MIIINVIALNYGNKHHLVLNVASHTHTHTHTHTHMHTHTHTETYNLWWGSSINLLPVLCIDISSLFMPSATFAGFNSLTILSKRRFEEARYPYNFASLNNIS